MQVEIKYQLYKTCCKAGDRMEDTDDRITRCCLRPSTGVSRFVILGGTSHEFPLFSFVKQRPEASVEVPPSPIILENSEEKQFQKLILAWEGFWGGLFDLNLLAF